MANLDARTDSFVTLLLDVSGRARPSDLQALSPVEAAEALRQYAASHPERGLSFDGQMLVPVGSAAPAVAAAASVPADDGMFEFGPAPSAPMPPSIEPTAGPGDGASPFGAPQEGATAPVSAAVDSIADADAFVAAPSADDFLDLPPLDGAAEASSTSPRVPVYWWILAVLFGWLGGLVGWLVLRTANPKGARAVLLTGIAATVLSIVLGVAAFFLGAAAFLGLAPVEQSPLVAPVPVSTSTSPTTGAGAASETVEATETP